MKKTTLLIRHQNTIMKLVVFISIVLFSSCLSQKIKKADIIFKGGTIYTVDENNPNVEAVVVRDGKIVFVGSAEESMKYKCIKTKVIDLENKVMIPGLIDAHGHFLGMGNSKTILDLTKAESYDDILSMVDEAVKKAKAGEWIIGRGWHQDKWSDSIFLLVYNLG